MLNPIHFASLLKAPLFGFMELKVALQDLVGSEFRLDMIMQQILVEHNNFTKHTGIQESPVFQTVLNGNKFYLTMYQSTGESIHVFHLIRCEDVDSVDYGGLIFAPKAMESQVPVEMSMVTMDKINTVLNDLANGMQYNAGLMLKTLDMYSGMSEHGGPGMFQFDLSIAGNEIKMTAYRLGHFVTSSTFAVEY